MGKCQICGEPTKKEKAKFCSKECKNKAQKGKKVPLDPTKKIRYKFDEKIFEDYENRSGILRKHSESLGREFNWDDWEIVETIDENEYWNCPECGKQLKSQNGKDGGGWIFKHLNKQHGYESKIKVCERYPEYSVLWPVKLEREKNEQFIQEHEDNRVQCLECGNWFKKITNRHLKDKHNGMEISEYKRRHPNAKIDSLTTTNKLKKNYEVHLGQMSFESNGQKEIKEFIESLGFSTKTTRSLIPGEIDIYIEEKNLAIEFNGLYHHSFLHKDTDRKYHVTKTINCEEKGVHLIQIFEDDWRDKREIVKSRLRNLLGLKADVIIYGRKCKIQKVSYKDSELFINNNHLQGWATTPINYGLYYEGELVSLMSFKSPRFQKHREFEYELVRFCNKVNTSVLGAASKLLNKFIEDYAPSVVYSYADRCWSCKFKSNLYDTLGFKRNGETEPNYWYMQRHYKRLNKWGFQPHILKKKYPELTENWVDEKTAMVTLGYDWIYDCGSIRYILDLQNTKSIQITEINSDLVDDDSKYRTIKPKIKIEREDVKRKTYYTICKICNVEMPTVGLRSHVENRHGVPFQEYNKQYNHLNRKQLEEHRRLEQVGDQFKCLECNQLNMSHRQLVQHINKFHESWESYALKHFFEGIHPRCKCGCGTKVGITTKAPYRMEFITGHNSIGENNGMFGRQHSKESKQKMSKPKGKRT